MSGRIRVGVFGVGALGQHHARIYAGLPDVELVGVYDVDAARSAEIAARHGTRAFTRLEELAACLGAASVVVPTDRHLEVFEALAQHGVHMLVEKPIAATTQEAEKMVETARRRGLTLQVGHIERFNPVMRFLEQRLTQPRFIETSRLAPYPPPREGLPPRGTEVGVLLDLMIHDLELVLHLVRSPVKEIHATGTPVLSPTEDIANARILFANGCVANLTASRVGQDRVRKLRLFQPDAYLSLDFMNQSGKLHRVASGRIEVEDVPVVKGDALCLELTSFLDCVRRRAAPAVDGQQGLDALRLADEIRRHIAESPS